MRILREGQTLHLLTQTGDELDAWERSPQNREWKLSHVWKSVVFWWFAIGGKDLTAVELPSTTELYRVGDWEKPLLTIPHAPDEKPQLVPIYSSNPADSALAFAIKYSTSASTRVLFFITNDNSWHEVRLEGAPTRITDFLRIGRSELAVSWPDGVRNGYGWHLYRLNTSHKLEPLPLPVPPAKIRSVKTFDYPYGLAIKPLSETGQDRADDTWMWYYHNSSSSLADIHTLIPGAPERIKSIRGYNSHHILAIEIDDAPVGIDGSQWRYFYSESPSRWVPLGAVFPKASAGLFALKTFAEARGLAFQALINPAIGRRAAEWSAYYENDKGSWTDLQKAIPGAPARIWDICDFGHGLGLGLQQLPDSDRNGGAFEWSWFVHSGETWLPVSRFLSVAPDRILDIDSDDLSNGIAIMTDEHAAKNVDPFKWYWFVPRANGAWAEVSQILGLPTDSLDRAKVSSVEFPDSGNWRDGIMAISDSTGKKRWYLRDATDQWVSIDDSLRDAKK